MVSSSSSSSCSCSSSSCCCSCSSSGSGSSSSTSSSMLSPESQVLRALLVLRYYIHVDVIALAAVTTLLRLLLLNIMVLQQLCCHTA